MTQEKHVPRVVIALGGNALEDKNLSPTAQSQRQVIAQTAEQLAEISCAGYEMALVHGNGPQVGRILLASQTAAHVTPALPFDVCGAMSQGYIGYHLQQCLASALCRRKRCLPVVSVVTQIVVEAQDPAFASPTKPIGIFYDKDTAHTMARELGYPMREDAGRGWRRVVASPKPQRIVEIDTLQTLWSTTITIACGGGGVPVIEQAGELIGVPAVIDKDAAAGLLAMQMGADILLILTEVPAVALHYGTPAQQNLGHISATALESYIQQGEFPAGSMLPKVQAAIDFVRSGAHKMAIITALDCGVDALCGNCGTVITA